MATLAAGIVDPTKAGKYPVVLSDALLGKDSKEVFTGVRYNHKPSLSSSTAPAQARIKPASTSSSKKGPSTYDLSFQDDGGHYQYKGTRGVEDSQYVLIFDPTREVFVLHKVDSMFNMNLVKTPNDNAETLRQDLPQLNAHSASSSAKAAGPAKQPAKGKKEEKKTAAKPRKPASKPKAEAKPVLAMPEKKSPPKPAPASKPRRASDDSEEESSDDDLGLTIENPGGEAPRVSRDFSPNLFGIRRFSDLMNDDEEEERNNEEHHDADGEDDDDEPMDNFVLPSPINRQMEQTNNAHQPRTNEEDEDEDEDEEMEDVPQEQPPDEEPALDESDLEAALLAELGEGDQQESDVSEEE